MDAILLVLRTGMQWNALGVGGICSSSSAHRCFQEWQPDEEISLAVYRAVQIEETPPSARA